jgi:hypothetical protein
MSETESEAVAYDPDDLDQWYAEQQRRRAANRLRDEKLYGSADIADWMAPPPLTDLDTQLAEHAAQLRNVARRVSGDALITDHGIEKHIKLVTALTRVIQTNVAIAKVLKAAAAATSKTVHGGEAPRDPQG